MSVALSINMCFNRLGRSGEVIGRLRICMIDETTSIDGKTLRMVALAECKKTRYHSKPKWVSWDRVQDRLSKHELVIDHTRSDSEVQRYWLEHGRPAEKALLKEKALLNKKKESNSPTRPLHKSSLDSSKAVWAMVSPIVADEASLKAYLTDGLPETVKSICKEHQVSRKTLLNHINRCLARGGTMFACMPDYIFSAFRRKLPSETKNPGTKRGRSIKLYAIESRNWTLEDTDALHSLMALNKDLSTKTIYDLYIEFCSFHLNLLVHKKNASTIDLVGAKHNGYLSEEQFRYHLNKHYSKDELLTRKLGENHRRNNRSAVTGSSFHLVRGPSIRYEIDTSQLEIYVRADGDEGEVVSSGRYYLTIVVDVFSKMIVGFYLSPSAPCWESTAEALISAFSDKVEFCRQFGISIEHSEWSCNVSCHEIALDNGPENVLEFLRNLLKQRLGIFGILPRRAGMGSDKGDVEVGNSLVGQLIRNVQGKVKKLRKDIQHASKRATLDHKGLNAIICRSVMELKILDDAWKF